MTTWQHINPHIHSLSRSIRRRIFQDPEILSSVDLQMSRSHRALRSCRPCLHLVIYKHQQDCVLTSQLPNPLKLNDTNPKEDLPYYFQRAKEQRSKGANNMRQKRWTNMLSSCAIFPLLTWNSSYELRLPIARSSQSWSYAYRHRTSSTYIEAANSAMRPHSYLLVYCRFSVYLFHLSFACLRWWIHRALEE